MAEGVNLFDLAAKVTADTKDAERNLTSTQKKVLDLANQFKDLDTKATASTKKVSDSSSVLDSVMLRLRGTLSGTTTASLGLSESMSALTGPLGLAVVGMAAVTSAGVLLTKEFIGLAVSTAEWQGNLYDLSQQVGISAQTLSALEIVAATTGGNLQSMAASLGIFQKKLEEAQDDTSKQALLFRRLGVDTNDTEEALRGTLSALAKMPEGYQQTAAALELFGRSGKGLLAIAKESNGDLDAMMDKFRELGVLVSNEDAKAADEFNDQLKMLGFEARAAGAAIGKELMPYLLTSFRDAEKIITRFGSAFKAMGEAAVEAIPGLVELFAALHAIADISDYLASHKFVITYDIQTIGGFPIPIPGVGVAPDNLSGATGSMRGINPFAGLTGGFTSQARGGGGRGGAAKQAIDEVAQALEKQKQEIEEAFKGADQFQKEIDRLVLSEQKHKRTIDDARMSQLSANAEQLRGIETNKIATDFMRELKDGLNTTGVVTDKYDDQVRELNKTLAKYHTTLSEVVGKEAEDLIAHRRMIDALEREAEAMQQLNITRQRYADILKNTRPRTAGVPENPSFPIIDLGGGSVYGVPTQTPTIEDVLTGGRQRRALPDYYQMEWEKIRQQAGAITQLLSQSIHDGFRNGMKAGAIEFAQGILQMIESKMLNKLADAITDAILAGFGKAQGGGSGGSWWQRLLGIAIGAAGGAAGGGAALPTGSATDWGSILSAVPSLPHLAGGLGYVPFDNYPALLHRGERVMTAAENARGTVHNHYWNIATRDARSFMSEDTQRQMAQRAQRVMQHAALTG